MPLFEVENRPYLTKSTLWLMAIGAGLVVANNYYSQPLLGMMAREFGETEAATSKVAMFTQIGYAMGLLLIIPLGDMFKRKRIILIDFIFIILSLLSIAYSQSLTMLITSSFFVGLTSVIPQGFVSIAAQLSAPKEKDRNVATVMSGLLIGILASRVFSGVMAEYLGWREVYLIAAAFMLILGILLLFKLPEIEPTFSGSYGQLMSSILYYAKNTPNLQLASLRGALGFGSFSIFWTNLTFHLEQPPFFQGSDVAGMFGVIGIAGALAASLVGYFSGKVKKNVLIAITCSLMIISWIVFGGLGYTYIGLIIGIILLDMGLQGMHVTNQTIVFSSHPEATNRLNTFYMTSYFIGGSAGTFIGGKMWGLYGWTGTVAAGGAFVIVCLILHLILSRRIKEKK